MAMYELYEKGKPMDGTRLKKLLFDGSSIGSSTEAWNEFRLLTNHEPIEIQHFHIVDSTLNGIDFSYVTFKSSDIGSCSMQGANFNHSTWERCFIDLSNFDRSKFSATTWLDTKARQTTFNKCPFDKSRFLSTVDKMNKTVTFDTCSFESARFSEGAEFDNIRFAGGKMNNADFMDATFKNGADFFKLQAKQTNFKDITADFLFFGDTQLNGAEFNKARGQILWAKCDLEKASLSGMRIQGKLEDNARRFTFHQNHFKNTTLNDTAFKRCRFIENNWKSAKFDGASLDGCDLFEDKLNPYLLKGAKARKTDTPRGFLYTTQVRGIDWFEIEEPGNIKMDLSQEELVF